MAHLVVGKAEERHPGVVKQAEAPGPGELAQHACKAVQRRHSILPPASEQQYLNQYGFSLPPSQHHQVEVAGGQVEPGGGAAVQHALGPGPLLLNLA